MNKPFYVKEFPSTPEALQACLCSALSVLKERGWAHGDQQFPFWLCLEEALTNAVQHGNKADPSLTVRVEISEEGERCRILIHDEGEGFEPDCISLPDCHQLGGRGVVLMKHFTERVAYDEKEHNLEMVFRRGTIEEGEPDND